MDFGWLPGAAWARGKRSGVSFSENLVFLKDFIGFFMVLGGSEGVPGELARRPGGARERSSTSMRPAGSA